MDGNKIVHLAFSNPQPEKVKTSSIFVISCAICLNKTWVIVEPPVPGTDFPTVKCACCGAAAGRMGWIHPDHKVD